MCSSSFLRKAISSRCIVCLLAHILLYDVFSYPFVSHRYSLSIISMCLLKAIWTHMCMMVVLYSTVVTHHEQSSQVFYLGYCLMCLSYLGLLSFSPPLYSPGRGVLLVVGCLLFVSLGVFLTPVYPLLFLFHLFNKDILSLSKG